MCVGIGQPMVENDVHIVSSSARFVFRHPTGSFENPCYGYAF